MKKNGILNAQLARIIASMGHSDRLVICDCGLPIPRKREIVDLALTRNIPRFLDVLKVVLEEFQPEQAIVAKEFEEESASIYEQMENILPKIKLKKVSHEELKCSLEDNNNVAFIRTGEASPYVNIILVSGVTF